MRIHTRVLFPLLFAVLALCAPASVASAKTTKKVVKRSPYPVITAVSPRYVQVGDYLTVKGRNFRPGVLRSTVAFYRSGRRVVFIKAIQASKTTLKVPITEKLLPLFTDAQTTARWIKLRVIGYKMGKSWTKMSRSVNVNPLVKIDPNAPPPPPKTLEQMTCPERAAANPAGDEDKDTIPNWMEKRYGTDPCNADTDGDGVSDGFEIWSAFDLNNSPYTLDPSAAYTPFTKPSANPLDPSDANMDFDGDGLTMIQEYKLWVAGGSPFPKLNYSDGQQATGGVVPASGPNDPLDLNGDGVLTDEERDFDGDGLSNLVEFNTTGTRAWWSKVKWRKPHQTGNETITELPYPTIFPETDPTKLDTDGDGIPDGADDQDLDGVSNFIEMQLGRGKTGLRVNPFNPCLPNLHAANCSRHAPLAQKAWPPFDGDENTPATILTNNPSFADSSNLVLAPNFGTDNPAPNNFDDYTWVRWPWYANIDTSQAPQLNEKWDGRTGLSP